MKSDPGLQTTRDVRQRISREFGNDPKRLTEYYMEYQRRFASRLRPAPMAEKVEVEIADRFQQTDDALR